MPTSQSHASYVIRVAGFSAPLSVLNVHGEESLSQPYAWVVNGTSPVADLATASILGQSARFTIQPIGVDAMSLASLVGDLASTLANPAPARIFHGLTTAPTKTFGVHRTTTATPIPSDPHPPRHHFRYGEPSC
jgi:uncharacterized protein involved in type VI secretion and phage assembly